MQIIYAIKYKLYMQIIEDNQIDIHVLISELPNTIKF